ncbi:MAG: DUF2933 domain-containing protein [Rhodocyclales bacterium]|nr:DUF2933 domain-containing protein [Rhodocyclales bacterium]
MEHDHSQHHTHNGARPQSSGGWDRKSKWAWIGFAIVAGFFLVTEHRAHLFGILPYLLLLACPLMHLFHHHGHGRHGAEHEGPHGDTGDKSEGETK